MQHVKDLVNSKLFGEILLVGVVSSIPRWEFIRVLNVSHEKLDLKNTKKGSSALAMQVFSSKTDEILRGGNKLANYNQISKGLWIYS